MPPDFNLTDPFAMLRQMWQLPSASVPNLMPPMTEQEIERKLAELKVVEGWLTMSLGMLSMQIRTLEMQNMAVAALQPKSND